MIENKPRYKHKLNMLEPAVIIFKAMGVLVTLGTVLYLCRVRFIAYVLFSTVGAMIFLLLVLLCIEQHQDKTLYLDAKEDDPDIK